MDSYLNYITNLGSAWNFKGLGSWSGDLDTGINGEWLADSWFGMATKAQKKLRWKSFEN